MEAALEASADDVIINDDASIDVLTDPDSFGAVKDAMIAGALEPETAEVTMRAETTNPIGSEDAEKMIRLLDMLEELDDVQKVYSNAEISDDVLAEL
jgi:transcriptional/translational regulatory protein YebC/TACO1